MYFIGFCRKVDRIFNRGGQTSYLRRKFQIAEDQNGKVYMKVVR